jgi:hypothetical protein
MQDVVLAHNKLGPQMSISKMQLADDITEVNITSPNMLDCTSGGRASKSSMFSSKPMSSMT